jgi:hypothetical protein
MLDLIVQGREAESPLAFSPRALIIAGWAGRDAAAIEAHVLELEALGVSRPKSFPVFYRVDVALLTHAPAVQIVGRDGSGEVEAVLWKAGGELYVGIGSDHTDRKLEAYGITLSKQVCAKPVSNRVWRWRDVADHWDEIVTRSRLRNGDEVYQEGPMALTTCSHCTSRARERHLTVQ